MSPKTEPNSFLHYQWHFGSVFFKVIIFKASTQGNEHTKYITKDITSVIVTLKLEKDYYSN